MKKKNKTVISIILFATIVSLLFAGCKPQDSSTEPAKANLPSDTMETVVPNETSNAPVPITIALNSHPNVINYEDNMMTLMLEEDLNVDLSFLLLPNNIDEARTKLSLMISSGSALTDVILMDLGVAAENEYAEKGIIVSLDDFYANPEMTKNLRAIPEADMEYILNNIKAADGKTYCVPGFSRWWSNEAPFRIWINNNWLSNANLAVPTTTDEFYNVLKTLVQGDPNGNGKNDEIGIIGSNNGWAQNPIIFLMNAFVYANDYKDYFMVDDNGNIVPSFTQVGWKKGLEYMKMLVDEGLLSPLSFTQDETQLKALINQEDWLAASVSSASATIFLDELEDAMVLVPPLLGPDGERNVPYNPPMPKRLWYVTKDSESPETAFSVGELMLLTKYSYHNRYGEYGVDWTDDPEITKNYVTQGGSDDVSFAWTNRTFWGNPQNKCWHGAGPYYRDFNITSKEGKYSKDDLPERFDQWPDLYPPYFPPAEKQISALNYTSEELAKIENAKTSIDAFVEESTVAFITGNRPLSDWDDYLEELNAMGLDEYVEAAQAAFDRTH